jgi:hypothetical protein
LAFGVQPYLAFSHIWHSAVFGVQPYSAFGCLAICRLAFSRFYNIRHSVVWHLVIRHLVVWYFAVVPFSHKLTDVRILKIFLPTQWL